MAAIGETVELEGVNHHYGSMNAAIWPGTKEFQVAHERLRHIYGK